jgi:hypothetical protein
MTDQAAGDWRLIRGIAEGRITITSVEGVVGAICRLLITQQDLLPQSEIDARFEQYCGKPQVG